MKHVCTPLLALLLVFAAMLSFQSCTEDECKSTMTYLRYDPVFMTEAEAAKAVTSQPARELQNTGKIYYYGKYILVNERREGVHIIDNTNPAAPQNIAFIDIPGNVDMAVKGNILYADKLIDLVAIDISDPLNPSVRSTQNGVFDDPGIYPFIEGSGYIIDYIPTTIKEEVECDDSQFGQPWFWRGGGFFANAEFSIDAAGPSAKAGSSAPAGMGGSMARFTLYDDYLYTVGDRNLQIFDISTLTQPEQVNDINVGWGIETIYPYEDKLFIGSRSGMFIFDNSVPSEPRMLSEYRHWTSCDPVVVEGDLAYVTLRGGTLCDGFSNQLEVIDISDLMNPELIKIYPMDHPHGLAIRNQTLYLCDGSSGLKVFDAADSNDLLTTDHISDIDTYDAISVSDELLLVVGSDGLYQYDTSDRENLRELSRIAVTP